MENSYMEADCSQEQQMDKMTWLDRGVGSSPFEKFIRLALFSKSSWPLSRFRSCCGGDCKGLAVATKGVQTARTTEIFCGE